MDSLFNPIEQVQSPTIPDAFSAPSTEPAEIDGAFDEYSTEVLDSLLHFDGRPNSSGADLEVGLSQHPVPNSTTISTGEKEGALASVADNAGAESVAMFLMDPEAQASKADDAPAVARKANALDEERSTHALAERALAALKDLPAAAIHEFVALFNTTVAHGGCFAPLLQPGLSASTPSHGAEVSNTDVSRQGRATTHSPGVSTLANASSNTRGARSTSTNALKMEDPAEHAMGLKQVLQPGFASAAPTAPAGITRCPPPCVGSGGFQEPCAQSASNGLSSDPNFVSQQAQAPADRQMQYSHPDVASNQEVARKPLGPAAQRQYAHSPARFGLDSGQPSSAQSRTQLQGFENAATSTQHPATPSSGPLTPGQTPPRTVVPIPCYQPGDQGRPGHAQDPRRRQTAGRIDPESCPPARNSASSASVRRPSPAPLALGSPAHPQRFLAAHKGREARPPTSAASPRDGVARMLQAPGGSGERQLYRFSCAAAPRDPTALPEPVVNRSGSMSSSGMCREGPHVPLRTGPIAPQGEPLLRPDAIAPQGVPPQPHYPAHSNQRPSEGPLQQNHGPGPLEVACQPRTPQRAPVPAAMHAAAAPRRRTPNPGSAYSSNGAAVLGAGFSLAGGHVPSPAPAPATAPAPAPAHVPGHVPAPVPAPEPLRNSGVDEIQPNVQPQDPAHAGDKAGKTPPRSGKAAASKAGTGAGAGGSRRKTASRKRAAPQPEADDDEDAASVANLTDAELLALRPKKQRKKARFDSPVPSRFCHVCSRTPKNVRLAVCAQIKEGVCRKVVCERCFVEYQYGDFQKTIEEQTWNCPHCEGCCPDRAQCRTYSRINDRLRVTRLKQPKRQTRRQRADDAQKTEEESHLPASDEAAAGPSALPGNTEVEAPAPLAAPAHPGLLSSDDLSAVPKEAGCMDPVLSQGQAPLAGAEGARYPAKPPVVAPAPAEPVQLASCPLGELHQPMVGPGFDGDGLPQELMDLGGDFMPASGDIELVDALFSPNVNAPM